MTSLTHASMALAALLVLGSASACGSGSSQDPLDPGTEDGVCEASTLVGSIEATLAEGFTSVQGKVVDAVAPSLVPEEVEVQGPCRLLRPPTLFCDPACAAGTTCDSTGTCVPAPDGVSIGTLTVTGLQAPVEMTASPPVYFYTNRAPLDHPGFLEGAAVIMTASGEATVEPFAVGATGIGALSSPATSVMLDKDVTVSLSWTAPASAAAAMIHIDLNIAQHGGTPGRIECEVPDTGQFDLPVSLTNRLLAAGFSGFPSLSLTRRAADHADTAVGCVQLVLQSAVTFEVEIPGLTSCSANDDCTDPETCQPDLTCG